jgi:UDP-4-amino-4,6-dideoxy-N-acetyl-beta-L-altrosamine transaminase
MQVPRPIQIPYGRHEINDDDIHAVVAALRSESLTQGPCIEAFEKAFAIYVGAKHAVAVSNGTAALHLACLALGVDHSSTVITTPITFAASANCVKYCGGQVCFADIDPTNALIDLEQVQEMLEGSPAGTYTGVIPVDFAGSPVNLERLRSLADAYGLWILEDACHAPGGHFRNSIGEASRCGSGQYADAAIFSFHPVKHIACGEGGMVTTNRDDIWQKLLLLRSHGITKDPKLIATHQGGWYYEMQALGYNYRLTDMQAALGLSQVMREEPRLARRREIAAIYDAAFFGSETTPLQADQGHAYHLYVVKSPRRRELYEHLRIHGIHSQVHYIPVHTLPYYRSLGFSTGMFPKAEAYYEECLSLPMFPSLTEAEISHVIECVRRF